MKSRFRHTFCRLLTLLILAASVSGMNPFKASAASSASQVDAVLAVDVSNSMNTSDPAKIGNEAMKMFIDMLSEQDNKVGIVAYTDVIQREKALLTVKSQEDKNELKEFIDGLNRGAYTDTSVGIKEAVNLLQDGAEPSHAPMIVMLADGNNDLNESTGRTETNSQKDMEQAIAEAKQNGIPIYTIGLNADGKLNKESLANIAEETGGKSFITSNADDLPGILSEIFASSLDLNVVPLQPITGNGDYQDVTVNVPNENVLEANISIMSSQPIDARLVDPDGNTRKLPADDILLSKSKSYSLIKMLKPQAGDWKLQIKGVDQDKIDINLVFNYDLGLSLSAIPDQDYAKGDNININAYLTSGGQQLQDTSLYEGMNAVLNITDLDTGKTDTMELDHQSGSFSGTFKIPEDHNYELKVRAEEESFFRETVPVTIRAGAAGPGSSSSAGAVAAAGKTSMVLPAVLIGLVVLILLAAAFFIWKYFKKASRGFVGQMVVEVRDENTGEKSYPQYRKLSGFRGKFNLHQLMQLAPEFAETEKVVFTPASGDRLTVRSTSDLTLEKSGRAVDASRGVELKNGDRLSIPLGSAGKTIFLEYLSVNS
ncbi:VWA domain-containing protein [Paenibacillus sp. P96]|uniref:VWA domain-containing protein n=1 Tax=Paenibacillus zeirhizosphaerae TaxID=2987519 RepID=A0ABT9FRD9_9BACL|nr:vWA domain-containing protein [Paenibacillus sp. P96]MDP4097296.1 VWA domain-containing protein [Paenibacillus sp. P96]